MIVLSNLAAQEIQPGQAVTFDKVVMSSGCGECYNRQLPKTVKMRAKGIYELAFSGNVTSATAGDALQMAIAVEGEPLVETTMNRTTTAANAFENIATQTRFRTCCPDTNRVSVINTGTVAVTLAPNSALVVGRNA